jgi:hypothetical protein
VAIPTIEVDLRQPPGERWAALLPYLDGARRLFDQYATDLGGTEQFHDLIDLYRDACIEPDHAKEISAVAEMLGVSPEEALIVN